MIIFMSNVSAFVQKNTIYPEGEQPHLRLSNSGCHKNFNWILFYKILIISLKKAQLLHLKKNNNFIQLGYIFVFSSLFAVSEKRWWREAAELFWVSRCFRSDLKGPRKTFSSEICRGFSRVSSDEFNRLRQVQLCFFKH